MKQLTECQIEIKKLRESTGMNRKEFCECFDIPYRTVTEWERGTRNAPDYVLRLLAYYIRMENMVKEKEEGYVEELTVLSNLETHNAQMIREGKSKEERFLVLKEIAEYQMRILNEAQNISNKIEQK